MNKRILSNCMLGNKQAMTLVELFISIVLMGLLVVGISNIAAYARYNLVTQDRGMVAQNESAFLMEHIAKNIIGSGTSGGAIGTFQNLPVLITFLPGAPDRSTFVRISIDYNVDGAWNPVNDRMVGYRWYLPNAPTPRAYNLRFCRQCSNNDCTTCTVNWSSAEIIGRRVANFTPSYIYSDGFLTLDIITCWNPDLAAPDNCGTPGNPSSIMRARIKLPAVAAN